MSELHESKRGAASSQGIANELKFLASLIERIIEDDYVKVALGERSFLLDKRRVDIIESNVVVSRISHSGRKKISEAHKKTAELKRNDINILFDNMKNDIER